MEVVPGPSSCEVTLLSWGPRTSRHQDRHLAKERKEKEKFSFKFRRRSKSAPRHHQQPGQPHVDRSVECL